MRQTVSTQERAERNIEGVGDGFVEGSESVGRGFYRGITGLVNKPLQGARQTGLGGARFLSHKNTDLQVLESLRIVGAVSVKPHQ